MIVDKIPGSPDWNADDSRLSEYDKFLELFAVQRGLVFSKNTSHIIPNRVLSDYAKDELDQDGRVYRQLGLHINPSNGGISVFGFVWYDQESTRKFSRPYSVITEDVEVNVRTAYHTTFKLGKDDIKEETGKRTLDEVLI